MASKDPKIGKQGAAGKRKHVTVTIPQKLEIIKRPESNNLFKKGLQELLSIHHCGIP
jgi:hypothetical protein